MGSIENTINSTEDGKAKYDAVLKENLSNKQFLARILKRFVSEFKDYSIEDIENKYIEPNPVSISNVEVSRNRTNIEGLTTEDATLNEGNVYYDILFKAYYPNKKGIIGMYINIEAQNSFYPGYEIETRGVYYAARKLASQLRAVTKETDYGCLEKVYSIWICMGNVPNKFANTATLYKMTKNDIIGTIEKDESCYDLLNVVVLRMNDNVNCTDTTMEILRTLCSNTLKKKEKLTKLKELGLRMDEKLVKGVKTMCNLSELIEEKGKATGILEGKNRERIRMQKLTTLLLKEGKQNELLKGLQDSDYLEQLYVIYDIK